MTQFFKTPLGFVLFFTLLSCSTGPDVSRKPANIGDGEITPLAVGPLSLPRDYADNQSFSVISEPTLLRFMENHAGLKFSEQLQGPGVFATGNDDLLRQSPSYESLVEELEGDLDATLKKEELFRKDIGVGMNNDRRLFNKNWLRSRRARYELVGVVNRLDRVSFSRKAEDNESGSDLIPNPKSTCGEIRFIYRLAYQLPPYKGMLRVQPTNPESKATKEGIVNLYSRLPMTVNVVYWVRNNDGNNGPVAAWNSCKRYARAWKYPKIQSPDELAQWLISDSGPLSPDIFDRSLLKSIEVNLQASRTPSSVRGELGGQAEYLLRAYRKDGEKLVPGPLESTPDVVKIKGNPELKQELVEFLRNPKNFNRLDAGILLIPDKFLARKVSSVSPYASARLANRPFDQILSAKDFEGLNYKNTTYLTSPSAVIKRLNDMTCAGCHQGSATAGFHFLGMDYPETHLANSLVFEGSGHFALELVRRKKYLESSTTRDIPIPHRPFSVAPSELRPGIYQAALNGQTCGLKGGSFESWKCESGTRCLPLDSGVGEKDWGRCVPEITQAGDPCLQGAVSQTSDPNKDGITSPSSLTCGKGTSKTYSCMSFKSGFPGGMCTGKKGSKLSSRELLGHLAGGGFTTCLAQEGRSFEDCFNITMEYNVRGVCDVNRSCRPDYVCVRTPLAKAGQGACTPSYFMFQLRLDGHPTPDGTKLKDLNGREKGV